MNMKNRSIEQEAREILAKEKRKKEDNVGCILYDRSEFIKKTSMLQGRARYGEKKKRPCSLYGVRNMCATLAPCGKSVEFWTDEWKVCKNIL